MIGVALGITAVIAVNIANNSARESFLSASTALQETATHTINGEVSDSLYRNIRLNTNFPAQPVVRGRVYTVNTANSATIFGIDPIAYFQFNVGLDTALSGTQEVNRLFTEPYSAFATADTLRQFNLKVGDWMEVRHGRKHYDLHIIGVLNAQTPIQQQSLRSIFLTDIATAQTVLGKKGRLSSIQLQLPPDDESQSLIENLLPRDALLEGGLNRQRSIESITEAFQTNLTAMSLLALLVAIFLLYNTMTFLIIRRKSTIKILRAVGVSRRGIFGCVVIEAIVIGATASLIGLLLGIQLANLLLSLVEKSINNLYFPIDASVTIITRSEFFLALALGIGSTLLSTTPALREALKVAPTFGQVHRRSDVRVQNRNHIAIFASACLVLTGIAIIQLSPTGIILGFAGIYCMVAGYICLIPMLCRMLGRILRNLAKRYFGIRGVLASRALAMSGERTSVAICALCIAISATIGVGVMISSFRTAVDEWLGDRLNADIYISAQGYGDQLTKQEIGALNSLPGAKFVGVGHWTWLQGPNGRSRVFAVDYGEQAFSGYRFKSQVEDTWNRFQNDGVIISEPYAWKHGVSTGDTIELWKEGTIVQMPILGVYYDYSTDRGVLAMHREVYLSKFNDETVTTAAIFAKSGTDLNELESSVGTAVVSSDANIWRAQGLHQASMEIFDQTFSITTVLRSLSVIVAFIAVVSTLVMIQIDRLRELKIQNAIGFTSREIWVSASAEAGVMGLLAGILSIPLGLMLTWLLIWVVNQRSFGWTMQMLIDHSILIEAVALSVLAALLAGVLPAWRLAKRTPLMMFQAD